MQMNRSRLIHLDGSNEIERKEIAKLYIRRAYKLLICSHRRAAAKWERNFLSLTLPVSLSF